MIEGRQVIDQFEEMYISTDKISVLGISDFQGRIEDGSGKGEDYFGLANTSFYV